MAALLWLSIKPARSCAYANISDTILLAETQGSNVALRGDILAQRRHIARLGMAKLGGHQQNEPLETRHAGLEEDECASKYR